jgi:hypothetical protein
LGEGRVREQAAQPALREDLSMSLQRKIFYGSAPAHFWGVLEDHYRRLPVFRSAVIRSIDSTKSIEGLMDVLRWHGLNAVSAAGNALLSAEEFAEAAKEGMFTGFDEVWFLRGDTINVEIPSSLRLTSDVADFRVAVPDGLAAAMLDYDCCLAVGDGDCLNYATDDEEFARLLGKDATKQGML